MTDSAGAFDHDRDDHGYAPEEQQKQEQEQKSSATVPAVSKSAVVPRTRSRFLPSAGHDDSYAPGPIRKAMDGLAVAVDKFIAQNPEFADQPFEMIVQYMDRRSGFRTDAEREERQMLADEGVDPDYTDDDSDDLVVISDDL